MSILALTGKTAIVTGGAGGLGRSMVAAFADAGANVVVASRNLEKIEAVAEKICKKGQTAMAVAVDITDAEQVDHLIAQTVNTYGAVDIMVNNAGALGSKR